MEYLVIFYWQDFLLKRGHDLFLIKNPSSINSIKFFRSYAFNVQGQLGGENIGYVGSLTGYTPKQATDSIAQGFINEGNGVTIKSLLQNMMHSRQWG